ncbi:ABC transporter ATP-binding protein [Kitasatospora sp. NBC_01560]|uniref:ABC transporter ATP-binding protein n=1 Tax=Kitasatospora sp. NBC_01560 TaxID=2975965 RepID=UPI0038630C3C
MIEIAGLVLHDLAGRAVLDGVSLSAGARERIGIVGESGSGKTTLAHALLGSVRPGLRVVGGRVTLAGRPMLELGGQQLRAARRSTVSYLPQDPPASLTPTLRVERQIAEVAVPGEEGDIGPHLARVGLPTDRAFRRRFPHQLSGGQQQRLALARALAPEPAVLILDEPTTGLDALTQRRILDQVDELVEERALTLLLITHDLTAAARLTDRLVVMRAGAVVEDTTLARALTSPSAAYTAELVRAVPVLPTAAGRAGPPERPPGPPGPPGSAEPVESVGGAAGLPAAAEGPREERAAGGPAAAPPPRPAAVLAVRELHAGHGHGRRRVTVASAGVSFEVAAGECVALLGLSGAGKTTVARCVSGHHRPDSGSIELDGRPLPAGLRARSVDQRRRIQLIAQDATLSLNPRRTVGSALIRPLRRLHGMDRAQAGSEADRLLSLVDLDPGLAGRYPQQLSGGQRQRVAIARALAARPDVLLCDEITASLDTRVQADVLALLNGLRAELGLAVVFITHDLGVLARVADRVLVLVDGKICEQGPVAEVLTDPRHEWTRSLVEAAPTLAVWRKPVEPVNEMHTSAQTRSG